MKFQSELYEEGLWFNKSPLNLRIPQIQRTFMLSYNMRINFFLTYENDIVLFPML